jgi:hypothetical protein
MAQEIDHFYEAHKAAEEHLAACWAWMEHEEGVEGSEEVPEPDQASPFCGCLTCEIREILHAAEPHLRRAWEDELVAKIEAGAPCDCKLGEIHRCGRGVNRP